MRVLVLLIILLFYFNSLVYARVYKELNLLGGYSHSNNVISNSSVGFEYFNKLSNEYGDFLTLDFQARVSYDADSSLDDAWGLELHDAWAEYKLGLGKNIRLGHFSPAFGLEPVIDTHGTILQTLITDAVGFKKDWGVLYKAVMAKYDFALACQLGSGMGIARKDSSGIMSARLSSPETKDFKYGVSALYGRVLSSEKKYLIPEPHFASDAIFKKRLSLDMQYNFSSCSFKTEAVFGEDGRKNVAGILSEIGYVVPSIQELEFKLQGKVWDQNLDEDDIIKGRASTSISYKVNSDVTVRLAYLHDMHLTDGKKDRQVLVQFYVFT